MEIRELNNAKWDCQIITADDEELNFLYYDKFQPQNTLVPLRPIRQDTGNNPWETRPETGDYFSQGSFAHGMDQSKFHEPTSDPKKYLWSDGLKTDDDKLVHQWEGKITDGSYLSAGTLLGQMVEANGNLWVAKGLYVYNLSGTPMLVNTFNDATEVVVKSSNTAIVTALATDGVKCYAAKGDLMNTPTIYYGNSTSGNWDVYQAMSAGAVPNRMVWAKDRIIAACGDSKVYEVTTVADTEIDTLPTGWSFTCIWEMGAYIYVGARRGGLGRVYHYGLNSDASAIERKGYTDFPSNTVPLSGAPYAGTCLIGCETAGQSGVSSPALFQAFANDNGELQYAKIAEETTATTGLYGCNAVTPYGDGFYVGWTLPADARYGARDGLAFYDIARGAFYNSVRRNTSPSTKPPLAIAVWQNWIVWLTEAGLFYSNNQDVSTFVDKTYSGTATFISSIADWNNAGTKLWQSIDIAYAKPLPSTSSVSVYYTTAHPEENDWTLVGTDSTTASLGKKWTLETPVTSRQFAIKLVSNATTAKDDAPEIQSFTVRSDPTVEASNIAWQLQRVVRLLPWDSKGTNPNLPQKPKELRTALMNLAHQSFTFKEGSDSWVVRMVAPSGDFVPHLTNSDVTLPQESPKDGYLFQLTLEGTKT